MKPNTNAVGLWLKGYAAKQPCRIANRLVISRKADFLALHSFCYLYSSSDTAPRYRVTITSRVLIAPAFLCERGLTKGPVDIIPAPRLTGQAPVGAVLTDTRLAAVVVHVEMEGRLPDVTVTPLAEKARAAQDPEQWRLVRKTTALTKSRGRVKIPRVPGHRRAPRTSKHCATSWQDWT